MIDLGVFLLLLALGYTAGTVAERRHFRSLEERERRQLSLPAVTAEAGWEPGRPGRVRLVTGGAVVSIDYFKRFLAALRMIFGGRVRAYESLLDRARREAVARMKAQARGAVVVVGVRVETATIHGRRGNRKGLGTVEAFAYGTAVWTDEVPAPGA